MIKSFLCGLGVMVTIFSIIGFSIGAIVSNDFLIDSIAGRMIYMMLSKHIAVAKEEAATGYRLLPDKFYEKGFFEILDDRQHKILDAIYEMDYDDYCRLPTITQMQRKEAWELGRIIRNRIFFYELRYD